mmetsp:Transcript_40085/g.87497  ORF Transcript_40085/g.87497 Transcript_40085/m.87497 type:complete len:406 (+) Transcript_40085:103-1320(+)
MMGEPMTPPRAPLRHPATPGTGRSGLSVKNTFIEYSDSDSDSEDIIFARSWPSTKRGGDVTASLIAQYAAMKPSLEVSSARTSEAETDAVAQASAAGSTDFGGVSSRVSEAGTEGHEVEPRCHSAWVRAGQPSLIIPESPQRGAEAPVPEAYGQQHQLLALLQQQQQLQNHQLQQLLALQTRDQLVARLQAEQGEYGEPQAEMGGNHAALAAAQLAQLAQQGDQQALVLLQLLYQAESQGAGAPGRPGPLALRLIQKLQQHQGLLVPLLRQLGELRSSQRCVVPPHLRLRFTVLTLLRLQPGHQLVTRLESKQLLQLVVLQLLLLLEQGQQLVLLAVGLRHRRLRATLWGLRNDQGGLSCADPGAVAPGLHLVPFGAGLGDPAAHATEIGGTRGASLGYGVCFGL